MIHTAVFCFFMQLNYRFSAGIQKASEVSEQALAAARQRFDIPEDVFVFPSVISDGSYDTFSTRMGESTLRNYAQDASAGVMLLEAHDESRLGYGYSYRGEFAGGEALVDWYITRGINYGGNLSYASSDDAVRAVETGMVRDLSVGFAGGRMVMDQNGLSIYDRRNHLIPGLEYEDDEGRKFTATATIEDSRLAETSFVFKGSNRNAGIMLHKARSLIASGGLSDKLRYQFETCYRSALTDGNGNIWQGVDLTLKDGTMKFPNDIQALAKKRQISLENEGGIFELTRQLSAENARLTPLADDGKAYRADLIKDALAEGVRAHGDKFAEETYRAMLTAAPLDTIKQMRADWAATANKVFPKGRQTGDNNEPPTEDEAEILPYFFG